MIGWVTRNVMSEWVTSYFMTMIQVIIWGGLIEGVTSNYMIEWVTNNYMVTSNFMSEYDTSNDWGD